MNRVLRLIRSLAVAHDLMAGAAIFLVGAGIAAFGGMRGDIELVPVGAVIAAGAAAWLVLDVWPSRKNE